MYIVGFDVKSVMQKPLTINSRSTLLEARNMMLRYNISRVVVASNRRPLGILTEKDIARFLYTSVPSRTLGEIRASEVMSRNLVSIDGETDIRKSAKLMLENKISSLVVVDGKKNLTGIITKTDLVDAFVHNFTGEHLVNEFMTKRVFTVAPDEAIHMAIMLMSDNKISRVVVVKDKHPVGIITTRDLLPAGALFGTGTYSGYWTVRDDLVRQREMQAFIPSGIKAAFVSTDVMTPNPIVVTDSEDLAHAGFVMLRNRISGLPVVDSRNVLRGIITRTDIVKALASRA